jgi:hypothetical protein
MASPTATAPVADEEAEMLRHTTYKSIAAGALTMALAAGPGGVAAAAPGSPAPRDLRSADAIDSDLRSQARQQDGQEGFGWDDAAIGGAAVLGGVLAIGGGAVVVMTRRRPDEGAVLPR